MKRLLTIAFVAAMLLSLSDIASADGPDVYALDGTLHDLAWVRANYGNMTYTPTDGMPHFALRRVDITVGPATIVVRVLNPDGTPKYGQPVALSWPGQLCDAQHPDPNIKPVSAGYKTRIAGCAIVQLTDSNGYTGFGLSTDWYYRNGEGPGIIWILSPSTYSDAAVGVAMKGGTVHEGPLSLVFQEVTTAATPTPTATPIPGATPTSAPITADLTETNSILERIADALEQIAGTNTSTTKDSLSSGDDYAQYDLDGDGCVTINDWSALASKEDRTADEAAWLAHPVGYGTCPGVCRNSQ
jgi:hypothetical protein